MPIELLSRVHRGLIQPIRQSGRAPSVADLAHTLAVEPEIVRATLEDLALTHGVVLHPHVCEPWVLHPFSLSPSATWVEAGERGWWAPCMWCAFGISALVKGPLTIHTRLGGEAEDIDIHVEDNRVRESALWIHFAVPPRAAWDNVHHFCATVLPFRSPTQVEAWSARHAIPVGAVIPIQQCADLGREWYQTYAEANWRKWSVREAAEIFARVGLTTPFWSLPATDGGF